MTYREKDRKATTALKGLGWTFADGEWKKPEKIADHNLVMLARAAFKVLRMCGRNSSQPAGTRALEILQELNLKYPSDLYWETIEFRACFAELRERSFPNWLH